MKPAVGSIALLAALSLAAATPAVELRLRSGGYQSSYRIIGITNDTPAVVTVRNYDNLPAHDLKPGDSIYIHLVQGCQEANGYRKVAAHPAPAGDRFAISDLADKPIHCSSPFDYSLQSGFVGKYRPTRLNPHPRLMTPPSGPLRDRNVDQRGSGGAIGFVAKENGPAWRGMIARYGPYLSGRCDGITPAKCPNEEARMKAADVIQGWDVLALALIWQADHKNREHLNAAKYFLNHADRLMSGPYPGFACDNTAQHCGIGAFADWMSAFIVNFAKAYDIVHDELTPEQRQRFANVILNGWNGKGCTNQLVRQPGTVDLHNSTATGVGLANLYRPNDWVYLKTVKAFGRTGVWAHIAAVSDTQLTLAKTTGVTAFAADHYKVQLPWDPARSCGALYASGGHAVYIGEVSATGYTVLADDVDASATSVVVATTSNFLDPPPYYIAVDDEMMLVTAAAGSRLTVARGQMYTSAGAHRKGRSVSWYRQPRGSMTGITPYSVAGEWSDNLAHQRAVGYVMAGLALADDDPRAAELAEKAWNYYYELVYPWCADFWSGLTGGGQQDWGYQWGRWQANMLNVVLAGQFAFADAAYPEMLGDYFWRGLLLPMYWSSPGSNFTRGPNCPTCGETYEAKRYTLAWLPLATTFHPGPAAAGRLTGGGISACTPITGTEPESAPRSGSRPTTTSLKPVRTGAKRPIRGLSTTPPISAPAAPSGWLSAARTGAGPPP